MSVLEGRNLSLWEALKDVFNWYPKEYPARERKLVSVCVPLLDNSHCINTLQAAGQT